MAGRRGAELDHIRALPAKLFREVRHAENPSAKLR